MRTSTTQLHTKVCHAGVRSCMAILITPSVMASGHTKRTTKVARRLLCVAAWSVAWSQPKAIHPLTHALLKCCCLYAAAAAQPLSVLKQPCNQSVEDDEPAEATETISSDALATVSDANDRLPVHLCLTGCSQLLSKPISDKAYY